MQVEKLVNQDTEEMAAELFVMGLTSALSWEQMCAAFGIASQLLLSKAGQGSDADATDQAIRSFKAGVEQSVSIEDWGGPGHGPAQSMIQ